MYGTENLEKLVDIGFKIPKQIGESAKDGFNFFPEVLDFTDEFMDLIKVAKSWKDIVAEWQDRTEEEMQALYEKFQIKYDIPNDEVEAWVEDAVGIAIRVINLATRFKNRQKPA